MKRIRIWAWLSFSVVVVAGIVFLAANRDKGIQGWCQKSVHVGDNFLTEKQPPANKLVSVNDGVWTYEGGVVITVVDDQVLDKSCGA